MAEKIGMAGAAPAAVFQVGCVSARTGSDPMVLAEKAAAPYDLALVEACEQRPVNLWPALDTMLLGDWVARFAHGYSGRANSLSAIRAGARLDQPLLDDVIALYRAAGLPPAIRVTPLAAPHTADELIARGWQPVTRSGGMVMQLPAECAEANPDAAITLDARAAAAWLDGVSALQEPRKRNPAHLAAIVGRIRRPAVFATLHTRDGATGFGMAAVDRSMAEIGSIILAPQVRGQGNGRRMVTALLGWAHAEGRSAGLPPGGGRQYPGPRTLFLARICRCLRLH